MSRHALGFAVRAMDGMVYASVERPPVLGGKVKSYDDKDALKLAGVRQTIPIDPFKPPPAFQPLGGIAVIADNTWDFGGFSVCLRDFSVRD
jgi:hypothetical protein